MTGKTSSHPDGETLELYALGRLAEEEVPDVEEHLLACHPCQDAVARTDDWIRLMKATARTPPEPKPVPIWSQAGARLAPLRLKLWAASALAAAILALIAIAPWRAAPLPQPVKVALSSYRAAPTMANGPASAPIELDIDAAYLTAGERCRIDIVDERGRLVWNVLAPPPTEGKLLVQVPESPRAGLYWVRLFRANGELSQEFGLRLE